ncbi:DASH complex subunit Dad3-domain-containing protein [Pyronema omphalodes]|nr:DASH complex subunit Dad3-domain-containing protein [Pyronema omphalodes]KAI5815349.1 DASH complex subunit Dad3-domain-containing protein [Pyronema omphalodes]
MNSPSTQTPQSGGGVLTATERELLHEYTKLLGNLQRLAAVTSHLANTPTLEIMDSLRVLERKSALVFTLLKASVYDIFLDQGIHEEGEGEGEGEE